MSNAALPHVALNSAETLLKALLEDKPSSDLIGVDDILEPGSRPHAACYEQISRFNDAIKASLEAGTMSEKQALMFECRFIRSMRQLCLAQHDPEARGLDAAVRAGQATILFIKENGKWFTKMNRSQAVLCTGAYLAACAAKTGAWTFLLFTEDGDVHAD